MRLLEISELEQLLRRAPQPSPPPDLRGRLAPPERTPRQLAALSVRPRNDAFGWGRWWPALALGCLMLLCLGVVARQRAEIRELQRSLQDLRSRPAPPPAGARAPRSSGQLLNPASDLGTRQELTRLTATAQRLGAETADLERRRMSRRARGAGTPGSATPSDEANGGITEEAQSIQCVSNLKQLGLAVRVWSTDNGDTFPPNIVVLSNELSSPKVLVCPADSGRKPAADWSSVTSAGISYEYLAPSASDADPQRVMWRCPVHGHVTLGDGSVQSRAVLQSRNGALYFGDPATTTTVTPAGGATSTVTTTGGATTPLDPRLAQRYGLTPQPAPGAAASEPATDSATEETTPTETDTTQPSQ